MIWAIHAPAGIAFGSGKTLTMIQKAREFCKNMGDYNIVTNTPFTAEKLILEKYHPKLPFVKKRYEPAEVTLIENKAEYFKAFTTHEHTLFLLDEGGSWLNNYNWKKIDESVYDRFLQLRKADIHLIYTVQNFGFVAKRLREITNVAIEAYPIPKPNPMKLKQPKKPWVIQNIYRNPEYFEKQYAMDKEQERKYIFGRRFIVRMDKTIKSFDTNRQIKNV